MCLLREVRGFDGESLDLHDYSLKGCDLDSNTPERAVVIYRYETALQTQSVQPQFHYICSHIITKKLKID